MGMCNFVRLIYIMDALVILNIFGGRMDLSLMSSILLSFFESCLLHAAVMIASSFLILPNFPMGAGGGGTQPPKQALLNNVLTPQDYEMKFLSLTWNL